MTGPLAAVALLTDGLEACLTASKRPHFGKELVSTAGSDPSSCYQGAYQLRHSDAAGTLLWDSGAVASGGRAPMEVLDGALRVAGSPFLPLPCPPVRHVSLAARLRPFGVFVQI